MNESFVFNETTQIMVDYSMVCALTTIDDGIDFKVLLDERRTLENLRDMPLIEVTEQENYPSTVAKELCPESIFEQGLVLLMIRTLMRHRQPVNVIYIGQPDAHYNDLIMAVSEKYNPGSSVYSMEPEDCKDSGLDAKAFALIVVNTDSCSNDNSDLVTAEALRLQSENGMIILFSAHDQVISCLDNYDSLYDHVGDDYPFIKQTNELAVLRQNVAAIIESKDKANLRGMYKELDTLVDKAIKLGLIDMKLELIDLQRKILDALVA